MSDNVVTIEMREKDALRLLKLVQGAMWNKLADLIEANIYSDIDREEVKIDGTNHHGQKRG